ncbi:roadblock/LC7 domain-containing protein [uncultured Methanofollis sp.]|uniref:roadblock/LC7 domain-containing protein n=1 Tax=uncultured Methanofollis sp. TaxID=262500 RepID=UPI00262AA764|nr:roadblock/LC7 domain-containing protein [uncultured Methanofollis sp.]
MMLPDGKTFGSMSAPLTEVLPFTEAFYAIVRVRTDNGEGFVLSDKGRAVAAWWRDGTKELRGEFALARLLAEASLPCNLSRYGDEEYALALERCRDAGYLTGWESPDREEAAPASTYSEPAAPAPAEPAVPELTEESLQLIHSQPGVVAVSAFYEGFAVQSVGATDFERIAAISEDLLRAGLKIASDMDMGGLEEIILETPGGKLIIAPFGDLSLCVLTAANANLGLVRVALRSIRWRG